MSKKKVPELYVLNPDRRKSYGAIRHYLDFTEDVRFNTCSEIQFKVPEKICDPLTGKWIKNPAYDNLLKDNLIYLLDDEKYFSYPNRTLRDDYGVSNTHHDFPYRNESSGAISYNINSNTGLIGFQVQPETCLYNISVIKGYNWYNLSDIDDFGYQRYSNRWATMYNKVACPNFIPIQPNDVIAVKTAAGYNYSGSGIRYYKYTVFFYEDETADTCLGWLDIYSGKDIHGLSPETHKSKANPVFRFSINSLSTNITSPFEVIEGLTFMEQNLGTDSTDDRVKLAAFKKKLADGGYIRVCVTDATASDNYSISSKVLYSSYYYTKSNGGTTTTVIGWSFPYHDWLNVYSGTRFCAKVENDAETSVGNYELPLHWFVITDISEDYDGISKIKTVTALTYEYTISNKTVSLSEDTLPLYIPPKVLNAVNSSKWLIDNTSMTARNCAQYMASGVLNQILDLLPEWKIGHISSELMSRYRKIDDVDNANIYTFLMNDIEKLYQCYFVFDCDSRTISAYSQDDIKNNAIDTSGVILSWRNALKAFNISDESINVVTALRVHTSDDQYGLNLVTPVGNSMIYNFSSVLHHMDYVADSSKNRTLREAVEALMDYIQKPMTVASSTFCTHVGNGDKSAGTDPDWNAYGLAKDLNTYGKVSYTINSISKFREITTAFINTNMELIKSASALSKYENEYKIVMDKIETQGGLKNNNGAYYKGGDMVQYPTNLYRTMLNTDRHYYYFVNETLYQDLLAASKSYHEAKAHYEGLLQDYKGYYSIIKQVVAKTNLNYAYQLSLIDKYNSSSSHVDENGDPIVLSLLSPAEIKALHYYIREGDWTNEDIVFSEEYSADDIISTLVSSFDQAKNDMDSFISQPDYDFEADTANWCDIAEIENARENVKVGKTMFINPENDTIIAPILLEWHFNYKDDDDFKMTFTTNYRRKPIQYRYADFFNSINKVSVSDNTFNFEE